MSDSAENTNYEEIIDRAIDFSFFLQSISNYENGIIEKIKEKKIEAELNNTSAKRNKITTKPLPGKGHYQTIAGLDWNTELSEKIKNNLIVIPKNINTSAFHELTNNEWEDCEHITRAITYLNEQLKNSSINKFYKNVLMFILTNEKDSNFNESVLKKNCAISGGKSRRRRRKTNKKKTRKAKKKTHKKKRKGNKKRKTRARTRRKH